VFPTLSVRTGPVPVDAWNFKLSTSPSLCSSKLYPAPPSCLSSLGKRFRSCVLEFISKFLVFSDIFVPSFRRGLLPGLPGSCHPPPSSEKVYPPPEPTQTRTRILNFVILPHTDFVQDLYLKEVKAYKPAPKVLFPRPTCNTRPLSITTHSEPSAFVIRLQMTTSAP
jgi:hypothetical protein